MSHHVLVVDDDEIVRSGLAVNLERDGYRVSTAASGDEALACLAREGADLVLTDMVMDGVDGLELIRRVTARMPDLPIVVLTGHGTPANAVEAMRNGAADYILKPARPEEIAHRIRLVLDARDLRRRLVRERTRAQAQRHERDRHAVRRERRAAIAGFAAGLSADLHAILSSPLPAALSPLRELAERVAALHTASAPPTAPWDLNRAVERYLESERYAALRDRHPGTRIEKRLGNPLPPATGCPVSGAEFLARLIELAVRVSNEPSELLCTRVERIAARAEDERHYTVFGAQFGASVEPEDADRIFEPYYAERTLGWRTVSGFELAHLDAFAERCGGFAEARSLSDGRRLELALFLPVAAGEAAAEPALRARGGEHILVVDDGEAPRNEARRMLEQLGYTVSVAESGQAALAWAEERARKGEPPADLMVIDLVLGDALDGVDTFRRARAANPRQKALLVGGFVETARVTEALDEGVARYLRKPLASDELGRAVREALDQPG